MEEVVREVGVVVRVGSSHVIALVPARGDKALEVRHDAVIAAVTGVVDAETVMDLFASVKAQHNVAHFTVGKIYHIIVYQHSVGG